LLRGSLPRMVEISLGGVLYFSALEHTKRVLGYHDPLSGDDGKGKVASA
jgi:solute carrier family 25 S-adenosylmethionine transporter 26